MNPLFPSNPNAPGTRRHRHQSGQFFPSGGGVYIPYAYPVVGEYAGDAAAEQQNAQGDEDDRGGPTIFDRRGQGTPAPYAADTFSPRASRPQPVAEAAPADLQPDAPVPDQPQTLLVFKDGHQLEVQNYAVIGETLYDLTPGRHHKIPLAELDLASTTKQNDDRGIDFRLPPKVETSK